MIDSVLVSICIPTYNGEKYLRQCLDSCLDQEFSDYEIVICDDGSNDETLQILEVYAHLHSKITLFKNETNLGLVENWNKCISLARGKWIKFVFQDDYITKNCLRVFVDAITETTQLIVCRRNFILPQKADTSLVTYYTSIVRTLENTGFDKQTHFLPKQLGTIAMQNMCMNFIGEPSLIFFRKEVTGQIGYFNDHLKQICDFEFALRVASNYGLTYIAQQLCAFRIHEHSTTSTNINNKYFVLRYIEPLLYAYMLLYQPAFENFRNNLTFFEKFKLKLYFKVKAYQAFKINLVEGHRHTVFSLSNPEFKEIRESAKGDLMTRIVSRLKK